MLVAIGVSHKTASIEIREQITFSPDKISLALQDLITHTPLEEAVLLSTCNRTEIYGKTQSEAFQVHDVLHWWQDFHSMNEPLNPAAYYHLSGELVVKHLMRLASGLDSLALGETQILGQLKQAYSYSKEQGKIGRFLSQAFEASFSVAKKIRTQTDISKHPTSVSYLSVLMAKRIFTDLSKARVLLVGAGENIKELIPHLKAQHISEISITNRTYEKACHLAKTHNLTPRLFSELTDCVAQADIIISSTLSNERLIDLALVKKALQGQKHRPLLMLDLAVPRDIHEDVKKHHDVYLYTTDDLQAIADENKSFKENAAMDAEKIIAYESCAFATKLHAFQHNHEIQQMRQRAEAFRINAVSQAKKELAKGVSPEAVIESLAYTLTNQLMHEPTMKLKKALSGQDEQMIQIYKQIFGCKGL